MDRIIFETNPHKKKTLLELKNVEIFTKLKADINNNYTKDFLVNEIKVHINREEISTNGGYILKPYLKYDKFNELDKLLIFYVPKWLDKKTYKLTTETPKYFDSCPIEKGTLHLEVVPETEIKFDIEEKDVEKINFILERIYKYNQALDEKLEYILSIGGNKVNIDFLGAYFRNENEERNYRELKNRCHIREKQIYDLIKAFNVSKWGKEWEEF